MVFPRPAPVVFVIEDDSEQSVRYAVKLLKIGFRVLPTARNPGEFKRILQSFYDSIDLIVCDTNLGAGEKGFDLCERARNDNFILPNMTVIGVSSSQSYQGEWERRGFRFFPKGELWEGEFDRAVRNVFTGLVRNY